MPEFFQGGNRRRVTAGSVSWGRKSRLPRVDPTGSKVVLMERKAGVRHLSLVSCRAGGGQSGERKAVERNEAFRSKGTGETVLRRKGALGSVKSTTGLAKGGELRGESS